MIIVFDADGRIESTISVPDQLEAANAALVDPPLQTLIVDQSVSLERDYVSGGAVTPRPAMALTTSASTMTVNGSLSVTGVPAGTTVHHPDGSTVIDDGALDWSTTLPGNYRLRLVNFPYLEEEIRIEVTS